MYSCVMKQYCLELSDDEWAATRILDVEDRSDEIDTAVAEFIVDRSIEYNGHFGQNLWFSVGEENFNNVVMIVKIIRNLLRDVKPTEEES